MRALSVAARAYILCALIAAVCCALPALRPGAGTPWKAAALLAALYAACEVLGRRPFLVSAVRVGSGSFFPVLLAAVLLLPPSAAALVAVPGALAGHVERRPRAVRRVWRAAQLALAAWCAAHVRAFLDCGAALGGGAAAPDFPYVLLPAGAAVLAFCLVLTALDGGILATAERLPARTAWRGLLLRSVAPHCVQGLAGLMTAVLWRSPYGPLAALFVLLPMYISCWVFAQYHRERAAHQATIRALVQAVDIKDKYTRGHSERVGRASVMIAREIGMEEDRVEVLRFAGILHDVGKLGVPTRLLRKDGPLTPEERRVIELHPEYGHEMVRGIGFLGEARAAILHHHERLDGSGYPYGLAGGQIPEFARVVAVADAFDAMTSTRSYRRARPVDTALRELERCAGTQFDPRMVRALARALARQGWHHRVTSDEQADPRGNVPPSRGSDEAPASAPAGEAGSPLAAARSHDPGRPG
ncbi:HD-GYP domain-containing protein [Streptomyces chryseus]|uniref:Metal-dependent phosphohydrolase n=1 Tax=Streptomyces chryseus TaxID=68186 RepID=A0ABQ3E226_9ACTN|nr:HD-GYP domain-containing protein [Streptomyces chryseus]GHB23245.1 metal-dependent phosphohydrolase [Streptomyces chryseus]